MATLLSEHIAHIHDPVFRQRAYTTGRAICSPACAAVHSQYWIALGFKLSGIDMKDGAIINAQALADWIEKHAPTERVHVTALAEGDTAVCQSSTGYEATDEPGHCSAHIFAVAGATTHGRVWSVDNQHLGGYLRNIGPGPKTPVSYGLRLLT